MSKLEIQFIVKDIFENLYNDPKINFVKATLTLLLEFCLKKRMHDIFKICWPKIIFTKHTSKLLFFFLNPFKNLNQSLRNNFKRSLSVQ